MTVSNTNKAVSGFTRPLTYGTEFTANIATDAGVGNTILEITPLVPLHPVARVPRPRRDPARRGTGILVLLTNGIQMAGGAAATADTDYATIKTTLGPTVNRSQLRDAAECADAGRVRLHGFALRSRQSPRWARWRSIRPTSSFRSTSRPWRRATRCARSG